MSNLKIDYWYKALLVISTCGLLVSLTVEMKHVENTVVQLVSLGFMFLGIGEWINHPRQEWLVAGGKLVGYPRRNTVGGNLVDLTGAGLIIVGSLRLFI